MRFNAPAKARAPSARVPQPAARRVPAGLGLGASSSPATAIRPARIRWLGLAALVVMGLGVWAAIEVTRSLVGNVAPPPESAQSPPAAGTPAVSGSAADSCATFAGAAPSRNRWCVDQRCGRPGR